MINGKLINNIIIIITMYWLEQNTSCKLNVLLVRSHVVRRIRITYPLIHKSRAIHAYCRKAEPLVLSTDNEPLLSVITDSFSSAFSFRQFFSDGQPSHNENSCGFLCCLWLPLLDVLIGWDWDFMVDACATNALDSAAVVDVCNRFSVVHSFSSRLFVVHLLSSSDSRCC